MDRYIKDLRTVRYNEPPVQCITNFVTVNDCANIILASGASPSMAKDIREVAEEKRLKKGTGNATFRTDLIDAIFNLTEKQLMEGIRYEVF